MSQTTPLCPRVFTYTSLKSPISQEHIFFLKIFTISPSKIPLGQKRRKEFHLSPVTFSKASNPLWLTDKAQHCQFWAQCLKLMAQMYLPAEKGEENAHSEHCYWLITHLLVGIIPSSLFPFPALLPLGGLPSTLQCPLMGRTGFHG